jgi:hypothetical protein
MTVTGISIQYKKSGGVTLPEGLEFKIGFIAEHSSVLGKNTIDTSTDVEALYGTGELADELSNMQLNSNSSLYCRCLTVPTGSLVTANVDSFFEQFEDNEVSLLVFLTETDKTFAEAVKAKRITSANNKRYFECLLKTQKSLSADISSLATADDAGNTSIPLASSGFSSNDNLLISGTNSELDGLHVAHSSTDSSNVVLNTSFTSSVTFPEGSKIEIKPDDYIEEINTEFNLFEDAYTGIIAPTTEDKWLGAVAGRISKIKSMTSSGKVLDGGINGVNVNPNYKAGQISSLDSGRFIFLKRHPENVAEIHVNDDNTMFSLTDDIKTIAQARVINKAIRVTLASAFPLINNNIYPKTTAGASAVIQVASKGLQAMKDAKPYPEIFDYNIQAVWVSNGIQLTLTVTDVNRIKIVQSFITLEQQEAA